MSKLVDTNKLKFSVFQDERFVDLNLYQFGWERCEPLHSFGPHIRNHYLFHYIISGKGILHSNGNQYQLQAGMGFLIVPNEVTTYLADEHDPWEYAWIEFDGLSVPGCLNHVGRNADADAGAANDDALFTFARGYGIGGAGTVHGVIDTGSGVGTEVLIRIAHFGEQRFDLFF